MRRVMQITGLQAYACALAALQFFNGVRTDEAKYLLNIPYPHPPLGRYILSLLDGWSGQEMFWRVVLASLMVHAVWLVLAMARNLSLRSRVALAVMWLLCASVIYQSGTVMMAPLTALQGLVFVWLALKERAPDARTAGIIGLFWLASLFTAYQAALFFPLVWAVLARTKAPLMRRVLIWGIPAALLCLYTLTNPLAAASMINHAGKDVSQNLAQRFLETIIIVGMGSSIILFFAGTWGIVRFKMWGLLWSLLLVFGYVLLSRYQYYAILFTPLFIGGTVLYLRHNARYASLIATVVTLVSVVMVSMKPPVVAREQAKIVMPHIHEQRMEGSVLINGAFGHEWQYRSRFPVLRYDPSLLSEAQAVVCIHPCEGITDDDRFNRLDGLPVDTWIRQR